ncbi:MAG TPA: restriction endonuclease [Gemmatimonadaceae bacterium]
MSSTRTTMAPMKDLSPFERRIFDWLGHRSDSFLISLPFIAFLGVGLLGVLAISALGGRTPLGDSYVSLLLVWVLIAALVLYLATIEVMGVALLRTQRFRLLQLHQSMRDIQAMSWREFEDLVASFYQAKGYSVESRGGDGPDGGIDLIVRKNNLSWIVQCKHYRSQWVEEPPLRDLLGVVTAMGAEGGILVACGVFDERALAFAKSTDKLELIGGEQLRDLIADALHSKDSGISCPKCGSAMREKSGRFGAFLGCTNFPACHGWHPLRSAAPK